MGRRRVRSGRSGSSVYRRARAGSRRGGSFSSPASAGGWTIHLTALIDGITPSQSTFWKGLAAGAANLSIGVGLAPLTAGILPIDAALTAGALAYGASIVLYIFSAQMMGATRAQIAFASAPFFGVLFSVLPLGESLGVSHLVSGLLFIAGIALFLLERHEHVHAHPEMEHEHAHRHDDGHHDHEHPGLPASTRHTHRHAARTHAHPHWPDLNHRHGHGGEGGWRRGRDLPHNLDLPRRDAFSVHDLEEVDARRRLVPPRHPPVPEPPAISPPASEAAFRSCREPGPGSPPVPPAAPASPNPPSDSATEAGRQGR